MLSRSRGDQSRAVDVERRALYASCSASRSRSTPAGLSPATLAATPSDMFSIVHVLLPVSGRSPAEAIRASLAPFERGGRGDVPEDWLSFDDETEHVRALHTTSWVFTDEGTGGMRIEGGEPWHLNLRVIEARWRSGGCGAGPCGSPDRARSRDLRPPLSRGSGAPSDHGPVRALAEPARTPGVVGSGGMLRRADRGRAPSARQSCQQDLVRPEPRPGGPRDRPRRLGARAWRRFAGRGGRADRRQHRDGVVPPGRCRQRSRPRLPGRHPAGARLGRGPAPLAQVLTGNRPGRDAPLARSARHRILKVGGCRRLRAVSGLLGRRGRLPSMRGRPGAA